MSGRAGMIGYTEVFGFVALVGLPCAGALLARAHNRPMLVGLGLGATALIALVSGWLMVLMVRDYVKRAKYPKRVGLGWTATVVIVVVFAIPVAGSVGLFRSIYAG